MQKKYDEKADLDLVRHLIEKQSLKFVIFSQHEMINKKTPDFKIVFNKKLVGYCEVKSTHDEWPQEQLNSVPLNTIVSECRNDPVFNRMSNAIHKAASQFNSVNADHRMLNILAIVNHDIHSGPNDLRETLTGNFLADDGTLYPINRRISEGRIKEDKKIIDLYIMINPRTRCIVAEFINDINFDRAEKVLNIFDIDNSNIKKRSPSI